MSNPVKLSHFFSELRSNTGLSLTPSHLADLHYLILVYKADTPEQVLSLCEKVLLQDPSLRNIFRKLFKKHVSNIDIPIPQKISKPTEPPENILDEDTSEKTEISTNEDDTRKLESTSSKKTSQKYNSIATNKQEFRKALEFVIDFAEQLSEKDHQSQIYSHPERTYITEAKFWPFTARQFQKYWRAKGVTKKLVSSQDVDIPSTVSLIAENQGLFTKLVYSQSRTSSVNQILFLIDRDRDMMPFQGIQNYVISNIIQSVKPKGHEKAYFRGVANLEEERSILRNKAKKLKANDWVVIISDGDAASGRYLSSNVDCSVSLFEELQRYSNHVFWLNPLPKDKWLGSSAFYSSLFIDMIGLDKSEFVSSLSNNDIEEKLEGGEEWKEMRLMNEKRNVRLEAFYKQSDGKPEYLHLALLSSFFPAFTFDLLGKAAQNFPYKSVYFQENIPNIVSDLLGSSLVQHIGSGLYELYPDIKERLLQYLEVKFGYDNLLELSRFLKAYTRKRNPHKLHPGVLKAYDFLVLCYLNPSKAARLYLDNLDNRQEIGYYNRIKPNLRKAHENVFFVVSQFIEDKHLFERDISDQRSIAKKDYSELLASNLKVKLPKEVLEILKGKSAEKPQKTKSRPTRNPKSETVKSHIISLQITKKQRKELLDTYFQLLSKLEKREFLTSDNIQELRLLMRKTLDEQSKFSKVVKALPSLGDQILQLRHPNSSLLNLPWQLAVEDFETLLITKSLIKHKVNREAFKKPLPLKILIMLAAPENKDGSSFYEEQERMILQAFDHLFTQDQVQVYFTDDGSLKSLEEKLEANHYHILHFSGGSTFRKGQGWIELEDKLSMEKEMVSATDFVSILTKKKEHCPELVMLNPPQSIDKPGRNTFEGVNTELLYAGIPAVVSMALPISDIIANFFARQFYTGLVEKLPVGLAFQNAIRKTRQKETALYPKVTPLQSMAPQLYTNGDPRRLKFIKGEKSTLSGRQQHHQFIGRRKERRKALELLANKQPVLLRGQGGIGKTALAEHLIQHLTLKGRKIHPFFFNETTARLEDIIKALQNYLRTEHKRLLIGPETQKYSDKAMEQFLYLLREVLQVCTPCFVFDNLDTFQSEPGGSFAPEYSDTQEVIDFLYQNHLCPLLLTGRYPLADFPDAVEIYLSQVRFADFLKKCQQLGLDKLLQETEVTALNKEAPVTFQEFVQQLYQSFGGNYRALEFFDKLYKQHQMQAGNTLATLYNYLEQYKGNVLHEMSENLVFNQLLALLNEDEHRCLGLMYYFRRPVLPLAIAMQDARVNDEEKSLERLSRLTLLERHSDSLNDEQSLVYYYLTPQVGNMLEQAKTKIPDISEEKAGDYYYHVYKTISSQNNDDLKEAWQHYSNAKQKKQVNQLGEMLCTLYYQKSQFQLSQYYGLKTEELLEEATGGNIYNLLGLIYDLYGQYDKALNYHQKSLQASSLNKDLKGESSSLNNIGQIYYARGDYKEALRYLYDSLGVSSKIQDYAKEGAILNNISQVYHSLGEYQDSFMYLKKSLNIYRRIGDRKGEGVTLNNMASNAFIQGDHDKSLMYLQQSLEIKQSIGDKVGEGATLNNISQIYDARGDYDKALSYLEQSLNIRQQIGDRSGEGTTLNNISQIYNARGDYDKALSYLEQSLNIRQEIGDRAGEGTTLNNISQIYKARGDYEKALSYLEQSLNIRQEIGDRAGEGTTLNNISQIFKARGDYEKALSYLEQSLNIRREIGDRLREGQDLNNIGQVYSQIKDYDRAIAYLEQSLRIRQKIDDRAGEGQVLNNIGQVYSQIKDYDKALDYLQQSLKIRQKIDDRAGEGQILNNIGQIYIAGNQYFEAFRSFLSGLEIYLEQKDIKNIAITLHYIGLVYYNIRVWEDAILAFMQSYSLQKIIPSTYFNSTFSYLQLIVEKVGKERFRSIAEQLESRENILTPRTPRLWKRELPREYHISDALFGGEYIIGMVIKGAKKKPDRKRVQFVIQGNRLTLSSEDIQEYEIGDLVEFEVIKTSRSGGLANYRAIGKLESPDIGLREKSLTNLSVEWDILKIINEVLQDVPETKKSDIFKQPDFQLIVGANEPSQQYGILGKTTHGKAIAVDLNETATVSLFGVQGGGKRYSIGSVMEMVLKSIPNVNFLPAPLAGVIFHFSESMDYEPEFTSMKFPNTKKGEIEKLKAEFGAEPSSIEDIVILTPRDKVEERKRDYPSIEVQPIAFNSNELDAKAWMFLLGALNNDSTYIRQLKGIMRQQRNNLSVEEIRSSVEDSALLSNSQKALALQRLKFAEEYIDDSFWLKEFLQPGRLIIVDLRDEFIMKDEALGLFVIMLNIFSGVTDFKGKRFNKFIVFDDAHRYMDNKDLAGKIVEAIREMQHKGVSIMIASQDPPSLPNEIIELSSLVITHKFNSPFWLKHIQKSIPQFNSLSILEISSLKNDEAFLWASKSTENGITQRPYKIRMRPGATRIVRGNY